MNYLLHQYNMGRKRIATPPIRRRVVKLRGDEIPTPEALERANEFSKWFAANRDHIQKDLIYGALFDEDVLHDTYCRIYEAISLKGTILRSNVKSYFLRAYHRTRINSIKDRVKRNGRSLDAPAGRDRKDSSYNLLSRTRPDVVDSMPPEVRDFAEISDTVENILDYVRAKYEPDAVSLFEMYVFLQPDISYRALSQLTGVRMSRVWPVMSAIRADLQERFGKEKTAILTDFNETLSF